MNTIDCTPTWLSIVNIYIAVLQNPDATAEGVEAAISEIKRMAVLSDKYNALIKSGFNPDEFLGNSSNQ